MLAERLFILCGSSIPTYEGSICVRRCPPEIESVARARRGSIARSATQGDDDSVFDVVELLRCVRSLGAGSTRAGPRTRAKESVRSRPELAELRASVGGPIAHTALRALSDRSAFYLRDGGTHAIPIGCRRLRAVVHVIDGSVGVLALQPGEIDVHTVR